ncbi:prenyltransferase [Brevibacterium samyangense]|uniref:Prenyltransferase n=2 Tax=Brevibacterium samyangense TaxID=366888 RepID=A0ABN2TJK3_9MICO
MRELLLASRPISWVNTAFPFGAAYLLAGAPVDLVFVLGCLFFLVPYNLAMYGINDVFDYESDLRNPRKGGVEGGLVSREVAAVVHPRILWASAAICLPFVLFLLVVGSWVSNAILVLALFAVVAYSVRGLRFKEIPVLDSLTSSTHFSAPAWLGVALAAADGRSEDLADVATSGAVTVLGHGAAEALPTPAGWLVLLAFFLWGCAAHAFGAVQDVLPDRAGGLRSIATAFGARATVRLSTMTFVVAGVVLVAGGLFGPGGVFGGGFAGWPVAVAGLLAVPYVWNTGRFWNVTDDTSAGTNRGWKLFIRLNYVVGFLATLLMIVVVVAVG